MMHTAAANMNDSPISPIEDILEDARNGRPYILVDAEDRENEGDIIFPAAASTPELMAFTIRHSSGVLCAPMSAERAAHLQLPPMVSRNGTKHGTAFTVSIEAREGVTTGISAHDRARTVPATVRATSSWWGRAGPLPRPTDAG